jgi:putative ABC transport system permease protein
MALIISFSSRLHLFDHGSRIYITYKIWISGSDSGRQLPMDCLAAIMITNGVPAVITLPAAFAAGAIVGALTGVIHVRLHVRDLLSGIIMMTALYSVNLRIMGRANIPLYNDDTIFDNPVVNTALKPLGSFSTSLILLVIVAVVKLVLDWYMRTKSGFLLRAVGSNDKIVTALGVDKGLVKIVGLAIANGLCTLAGSLYAQEQGYADVSMEPVRWSSVLPLSSWARAFSRR